MHGLGASSLLTSEPGWDELVWAGLGWVALSRSGRGCAGLGGAAAASCLGFSSVCSLS